jgi:hypothetical protein
MVRKWLALLIALAAVAAFLWRVRPAKVVSARVSSVVPGPWPLANVSLEYGAGTPPVAVIVDVRDGAGRELGSVTAPGGRMLLEVPVSGAAGGYRVVVMASHRTLWGSWLEQAEFES